MAEDKAIERVQTRAIDMPVTDPAARAAVVEELQAQVLLIQEAMAGALVKGVHYGTIPGTQKPSLWQPGAEMLCQMFRFQTDLTRTGEHEDWEKGVFSYTYKCRLLNRDGELITEREGTCSSKEPNYSSKDAYQIRETLMQMAQKRAYVSAVKGAGAASAIFSQDDDIVPQSSGGGGDDYGTCPTHGTPYFKRGRMKEPGHTYGPGNPAEGDIWCNKSDAPAGPRTIPAKSPKIIARDEAWPLLDALVAKRITPDRETYVKIVLGIDADTALKVSEVTAEQWGKVKTSAGDDLASLVSDAPAEEADYEAPQTRVIEDPETGEKLDEEPQPW